jgi:ATP-dependent Clp protease ATP-binding subunit ClpX
MECSFCGKREAAVAKIIAGAAANICDECVATCSKLIIEQTNLE